MNSKPLLIHTDALNVLIIGGGKIGYRKASAYVDKCASLTVLSPDLCEALVPLVHNKKIIHIPLTYEASLKTEEPLFRNAHLIYACTSHPKTNALISTDCKRLGKLVNQTDQFENGNYTDMLYSDENTFTVAVSSKGSPWGSKLLLEHF